MSERRGLFRLEPVAARLLGRPAALALAHAWRRRRTAVLCYHRVAEPTAYDPPTMVVSPSEFQAQLEFLLSRCEIVPAGEVRRAGAGLRAAITFDDGRRELLETALPVLARAGAPSTVFCCSAVVAGETLWWDRLEAAVRAAPLGTMTVRVGSRSLRFELDGESSRSEAHHVLFAACGAEPQPEAAAEEAIAALGEVSFPDALYLREADLPQVRRLGAEVGSHGRTHARLTALDDDAMAAELADSRGELERALGVRVATLAYPYGDRKSVDRRVVDAAAGAGYVAGFTGMTGTVGPGADAMCLPRVPVHCGDWPNRFAGKAAGFHPAVYAAAGQLAGKRP